MSPAGPTSHLVSSNKQKARLASTGLVEVVCGFGVTSGQRSETQFTRSR